jgi:excisionase family DNA binding protein
VFFTYIFGQRGRDMPLEKWPSVQEIAEYLGVKPGTLYKWLTRKYRNIPAHKVGRLWKFKVSEIDKWVKCK